ncbi:hypothetical protein KI387_013098, partial [Taxus chinensis]
GKAAMQDSDSSIAEFEWGWKVKTNKCKEVSSPKRTNKQHLFEYLAPHMNFFKDVVSHSQENTVSALV